ncbi:MAG: hypothetical protein GY816_09960 [Cytophagales bacterium]|nr:hypothetical protein [Cytophagales bacterium]
MIRFFLVVSLFVFLAASDMIPVSKKINGVSLEMPPRRIGIQQMKTLSEVNAGWVAMIPYAFTRPSEPTIRFAGSGHWWGETVEGTSECIRIAHESGLKVMLKPHVWVSGTGWPGDYDLKDEAKWKIWEKEYTRYVMTFAKVAADLDVELYCIGTEYRKAAAQRPNFWKGLVKKVREVYDGKVTYAANWDNYRNIKFWGEMDYIGVDAYFPLSKNARPSVDELKTNWTKWESKLKEQSELYDRPVLFTEYGYKSIEHTNTGHWNYKEDTLKTSMENQVNAYEALYQSVWQRDWMAGGFLWKWHVRDDPKFGGTSNRRYTPQGKPASKVIAKWYGKD